KGKGLRSEDVAAAAGLSRSTYFAKMSGKGSRQAFKAGEVALIAQYLGVHVSQLYDGLGGTFIPDEVSLPRLDSNQQPFGLQPTLLSLPGVNRGLAGLFLGAYSRCHA